MKCNKLVVITGLSCEGKTTMAVELRDRFGYHIIHTDTMYLPIGRKGLSCQVGEEDEEKNGLIREHLHMLTETTIIEGSHIGNQKELDIFIRELGFEGKIYIFRISSPHTRERFNAKYKEESEELWVKLNDWFIRIYDLKGVHVVESVEEVIDILRD